MQGDQRGRWESGMEGEKERGRKSKDKKVNREGRYLVETLEEAGWFIFNGRGKEDEEGKWTYAGGRGESVIDYVVGDEEVWEKISRIRVGERIDSDHFPVIVEIKGNEKRVGKKRGEERVKWEWSQEGKRIFGEKLERVWEGKGEDGKVDWKELRENIQGVLREGQGREGGRKGRGWWDEECREAKKRVRRELRRWKKRGGEGENYRKVKREYNKMCEKKRKEENDRWEKMARKAKTEEQVWEVVNRERKRRRGINEKIKEEEWVEYFKKALGGVKGRVVRGMRGVRMDDEEEEITREEVRRAVKKVKEGKAAGGDGIPEEVWKYGGSRMGNLQKDMERGGMRIEEWNEGIIVPIRKQGNGEKVEEYRGITLMPTLYKIYAMILGGDRKKR